MIIRCGGMRALANEEQKHLEKIKANNDDDQCDQMAKLFCHFGSFTAMKFCPISLKK